MVEAAAWSSKLAAERFLQTNEGDPFSPAVLRCLKFLEFMKGKWAEGAADRAKVRSMKDGVEQQVRLVGSRAIYDNINGKDLFFATEHLTRVGATDPGRAAGGPGGPARTRPEQDDRGGQAEHQLQGLPVAGGEVEDEAEHPAVVRAAARAKRGSALPCHPRTHRQCQATATITDPVDK
jgi:hypothetical protein